MANFEEYHAQMGRGESAAPAMQCKYAIRPNKHVARV